MFPNFTAMSYITLSRKQLFELVWSEPFLTLSKKYHISDTGLRKICVRMAIPYPRTGHWQRIRAGSNVRLPNFKSNLNIDATVTLELRETRSSADNVVLQRDQEFIRVQNAIESDPRVSLVVPKNLSSRNPQIALARKSLKDTTYRYKANEIRTTGVNELSISVSKPLVSRALRIVDTLIKAVNARGHDVFVGTETHASVHGQSIKISLQEVTKRVTNESEQGSYRKYNHVASGILMLRIISARKKEFKDDIEGMRPLEIQLSTILAWLEVEGKEMQFQAFQDAIKECERSEMRQIQELFENMQRKELIAFRTLLDKAKRWQDANTLRDFLAAMEKNQPQSENFLQWCQWVKAKIDWFDPITNAQDPYMTGVDRATLEPPGLQSWERDSWRRR